MRAVKTLNAYNRVGTKFIGIQFNTLSKQNPVPVGSALEKIMRDYRGIINNVRKEPNAIILRSSEIKKLAH